MFGAPYLWEGRGPAVEDAPPAEPGLEVLLLTRLVSAAEAAGVEESDLLAGLAEAVSGMVAARARRPATNHNGELRPVPTQHIVERDGRSRRLTWTEWQLFALLWANPGVTFTRDQITEGIWGTNRVDRSAEIEMYVSRLRRKVERDPRRPELIVTVRGVGYRLDRPRAAAIA